MSHIRFLFIILTISVLPFFQSAAQEVEIDEEILTEEPQTEAESIVQPYDSIIGYLPESMDVDIQKLLEGWHASHLTNADDHCIDDDVNPVFSDTIFRKRMNRMPTVVPMVYNEAVRRCIDIYSNRRRNQMRFMMGMADYYFPMFEQILDANGMPLELKYLAIVESALNPFALSRVGASGLWQFMLPTAKSNGLEINSLIDERYDLQKATEAACRYLKMLYNMYDDWHLALAAYNCGPGGVNKAIARSGGKMDFWKIFPYLPRETRSYVPLFIAAAYVMTYHCDHNLCPVRANFAIATDTIVINRALHFDQIAEVLQIDKEMIRFYNPQYKREIIPGNIRPSTLRLPIETTFALINREDSVYEHRIEELLADCTPVDLNNENNRKERITHTVKSGETVYTIANRYGVTAQNLRRWNGLSGSRVGQGRRLVVHIDNGGLKYGKDTTPVATKNPSKEGTNVSYNPKEGENTYVVQSGDSLYSIAKRYPGVSAQNISEANGLLTTNLRIGQVLRIPEAN